ncbi:MAG: RluA family pseudouridine synthase [Clostridiales bacterium]|nr:RluA family pseudouridine synthase [Clostridiales bacterium]
MDINVKQSEKLIKFLIHNIQGVSFGSAQKLLRTGKVKVNSIKTKDNITLNVGDTISVYLTTTNKPTVNILYEDENILIVNKPQGIECATRDKSSENTYSLEEIFEEKNAIVIHRLDRLTEGIVILAKNKETARDFEKFFKERKIDKFYKAIVLGTPNSEGIKKAYLKKDSKNSTVIISDTPKDDFKEIITEYSVITSYENFSLLNIKLHTGRTHQIRAYFSHIGHPVANDKKYGKYFPQLDKLYKGYYLTAYKVIFNLPDKYSHLNTLNIEITPSWIKNINVNK